MRTLGAADDLHADLGLVRPGRDLRGQIIAHRDDLGSKLTNKPRYDSSRGASATRDFRA
jgi:hypothetical protein